MPVLADTFSPEVAARALDAGAAAINDIGGGADPEMLELVAERGCGYVLMHIEGPPRVDRAPRAYDDPVEHLQALVRASGSRRAVALGVDRGADRARPRPRLRPHHRRRPRDPAPARRAARARPAAVRRALAQGLPRRGPRRLLGGARSPAERARGGDRSPRPRSRSPPAPRSCASTTSTRARRAAHRRPRSRCPARSDHARRRRRRSPGSGCSRRARSTSAWSPTSVEERAPARSCRRRPRALAPELAAALAPRRDRDALLAPGRGARGRGRRAT